jgi:hypothetical protein
VLGYATAHFCSAADAIEFKAQSIVIGFAMRLTPATSTRTPTA